jgi:hypothetical protein
MTDSAPRYWRTILSNNVYQLTEEEAKKFYLEFLDRVEREEEEEEVRNRH